MKKTVIEVNGILKPDRIKFNGEFKKIISIHKKFIIKKYDIFLTEDEKRLDKIVIYAPHPNSNPRNNIFCIPYGLENKVIDHTIIPTLDLLLKTFNLDDCFFQPWEDIYIE